MADDPLTGALEEIGSARDSGATSLLVKIEDALAKGDSFGDVLGDAGEIEAAVDGLWVIAGKLDLARDALDAVLKEHVQTDPGWCESCAFSWPCSTVRAITTALLGEAKTDTDACGTSCWTPVNCPTCGNQLPPRGRSMPPEMGFMDCCDEARMNSALNPRHFWSKEEASGGD